MNQAGFIENEQHEVFLKINRAGTVEQLDQIQQDHCIIFAGDIELDREVRMRREEIIREDEIIVNGCKMRVDDLWSF